ncbi:MAG: 50S ribosomal protein L35 [Patescibacteria group bacterium]
MKQKTIKTAAKRVTKTKSGLIQRRTLSAQHLTQGKSKRALKASGRPQTVSSADVKNIKRMVPYI